MPSAGGALDDTDAADGADSLVPVRGPSVPSDRSSAVALPEPDGE